jgi:hypothetical protein
MKFSCLFCTTPHHQKIFSLLFCPLLVLYNEYQTETDMRHCAFHICPFVFSADRWRKRIERLFYSFAQKILLIGEEKNRVQAVLLFLLGEPRKRGRERIVPVNRSSALITT